MAELTTEADTHSPDKKSDSYRSQSPSPSLQSRQRDDLQQNGQSYQRADSVSSSDGSASDFAQTRTVFSVDQTDQIAKYCQPYVEDHEDTEPETSSSPPCRVSPFALDFMSTSAESSVFRKHRATLPKESREASVVAVLSEQQSASPGPQEIALEDISNDGSSQTVICLEEPLDQDTAKEMPEDAHTNAEVSDINEHLVNVDLSEEQDNTETITPPGILTILDEAIDQQFTDQWHVSLEPDSTDSSSLTIIVTGVVEESQQSWTFDSSGGLEEAGNDSITTDVQVTLPQPPSAVSPAQESIEHEADIPTEGSNDNDGLATLDTPVTENTAIGVDQDTRSTNDPTTLVESYIANEDAPQKHGSEEHSGKSTTSSPNISLDHASPGAIPLITVSDDSPDGSEKVLFRPYVPRVRPIKHVGIIRSERLPTTQARYEDQKSQELNGGQSTGTSEAGEEYKSSSEAECYEWGMFSNRKRPRLSSFSEESFSDYGNDFPRVSPDLEEIHSPVVPDQGAQIKMLISKALEEFKVDLLQQIEVVIQQSIKAFIPARNSAAATILTRPSPREIEEAIGVSISQSRDEVMNRIDSSKAEVIGYALRMAETTKKDSTETADALKKTLVGYFDHRLDSFEKVLAEKFNPTQNEAHLKTIIAGLVPSESITAMKKLPDELEKAKALATRNTEDVSKKLEQYAEKAEAVSNLCVRLDETLTSKQSLQNEIISNLCNILNQSTLQNNAINGLVTVVNPLSTMVRGISYDTNLIDAKLAKNADILTSVTDRTKTLEEAAARFGKIVVDAEHKFKQATMKLDQVRTASTLNDIHVVERFEGFQGQMTKMQAQLDEIAAHVSRQQPVTNGVKSVSSAVDSISIRSANTASDSPPSTLIENTSNQSEPVSGKASLQVEVPDSPPDSDVTVEPSFTITASFSLPNRKLIHLHPIALPIPESNTVSEILSNLHSIWIQELLAQGVTKATMELISIWASSDDYTSRRVIDNDMAYGGWYKAVIMGCGRSEKVLNFEFMARRGESESGENLGGEEPRSKKRKQNEVSKGEENGVVLGLAVWRNARQTKFERVVGYGRESGYGRFVGRLMNGGVITG